MKRAILALVLSTISYPFTWCFMVLLSGGRLGGQMALGLSDGVRDLPDFLEWGTFGVMFFGIPILACMGLFALMMFALQIRSASIVIAFGAATSFAILAAGVAPKGDFVNWVYRDISEIMGSIGAGAISAWLYWLTALHRPSTKTDDGAASP